MHIKIVQKLVRGRALKEETLKEHSSKFSLLTKMLGSPKFEVSTLSHFLDIAVQN